MQLKDVIFIYNDTNCLLERFKGIFFIEFFLAKGFGVRHFQISLFFCGLTIAFALRVNMSVGIVAMTKSDVNPDFEVYTFYCFFFTIHFYYNLYSLIYAQ